GDVRGRVERHEGRLTVAGGSGRRRPEGEGQPGHGERATAAARVHACLRPFRWLARGVALPSLLYGAWAARGLGTRRAIHPPAVGALATAWLARAWPDFVAVHMTWGAINELTTLTGYRRLAELAGHPVLSDLLARIMRDESRHFAFYFHQAARRLVRPRTARLTRRIVERFWAPVGAGVQPDEELRFLAGHLLSGPDGRAAARRIDETIRSLPGLAGVELMEAWMARTRP